MSEPDELFTLRNLFWLGNFQAAINEANKLNRIPAKLQTEKQDFIYRSYLALGQYNLVLGEVKDAATTPISLKAIKLLANYFANPATKEKVLSELSDYSTSDPGALFADKTFAFIYASMCMYDDNIKESLRIISLSNPSGIELKSLTIQIYLRMDRLDLAQGILKSLKSSDEDHVLTMLATAWIHLYTGSAKAQESSYIYDELIDKYGGSAMLLNGLAVSKMHQAQFDEAEQLLQDALTKAPGDADTLANLIVVGNHLQRPADVIARNISQLSAKSPNHPLLASVAVFEGAFDRVSASLKV